jgi:hypothetical protein
VIHVAALARTELTSKKTLRAFIAGVILAVAITGCGGTARRSASTTSSTQSTAQTAASTSTGTALDGCLSAGHGTHLVRFPAPGERVQAAVVGAGSVGVVLANQSDNTVCGWLPFPTYLARHGMRVLAFDYGHGDASREVQAAATFLKREGASPLVLIGASLGGAVIIDAGAHMRPAPAAVISLSAVPEATTYSFPADARRLTSPIFQIGSTEDQLIQYGHTTRSLFAASRSPAKRLLLLHGADHGVALVNSEAGNKVREAILAFIRTHASP